MSEKEKNQQEIKEILKKNLFTYFNAIFLVLSILLIVTKSYRNLTFLPVVIANVAIGIFQQLRAKKILDQLTLLSKAKYRILRDGKRMELTSDHMKKGDVIFLSSGQQIPADATVTSGKIAVNEALLTGEADEIDKEVDAHLLSGSFVVSGECTALLDAVGKDSYIERLAAKAKKRKEHPSEMVGDIDRIVKFAGVAIIPIGLGLFLQGMFVNSLSLQESVVSMVAAVIGMIPEGLYLLVTVTLALSAARLAQNQVLLHDMRSTETLARVDVLCVDKTGTITTDEMNVEAFVLPSGDEASSLSERKQMLAAYVHTVGDRNITSQALKKALGGTNALQATEIAPFTSKLKYSSVTVGSVIYRLGAPEFVLGEESLQKQQAILDREAGLGRRVLVFAKKEKEEFVPLLFVTLSNGLRKNVAETFAYLNNQEVRIMVISGDNARTVSEIAQSVGIEGAEQFIDATKLKTDKDFVDAVQNYTVFGRVKPEQKKQIVKALHAKEKRVAMTGDGVNDILAMKEADCSIAMGSGSDAAMQAAQVVLLDSDFSHMRQIIAEGRRDINNITRSATLFLYKNIFSMLLGIFSIINAFSYPLQPSQISLVSGFNIGIPAFFLALEPTTEKQHGRFLRVVSLRAMPAALTSFFSIAALVIFAQVFSISTSDVGVASTFLLSIVGFMILWKLCKPMNPYRTVVLIGCMAGFVFCAYFFSSLFAISSISYPCLLLAIVFAIAEESIMRYLTMLFDWITAKVIQQED